MTFELWWLLVIPLAFAFGWVAARLDLRQMLSEQGALPRSYFKGLNFLLNEQPDKAIDAFIEVARLDPETVELHFALGSLFRRRGETERAIRVHQNLVSRPDLRVTERDHALYELGQDFLRAGMLDRAEESLKLLMSGEYALPAKRVLLELYQVEKEWRKAIEAARELRASESDDTLAREIAQFCCELAQERLASKQAAAAVQWLEQALVENPANVRATILLGDVAMSEGRAEEALERWQSIEQQDAAYLPLVAERVMQASMALGQAASGLEWLRRQSATKLGGELLDVAYKYERELAGTPAALKQAREQMLRQPSFAALTKVYEAQVELAASTASVDAVGNADQSDASGNVTKDLTVARDLLKQRTRNLARYTCHECGFRARLFYWQCPGCNRWETYAPRRAEVATSGASM